MSTLNAIVISYKETLERIEKIKSFDSLASRITNSVECFKNGKINQDNALDGSKVGLCQARIDIFQNTLKELKEILNNPNAEFTDEDRLEEMNKTLDDLEMLLGKFLLNKPLKFTDEDAANIRTIAEQENAHIKDLTKELRPIVTKVRSGELGSLETQKKKLEEQLGSYSVECLEKHGLLHLAQNRKRRPEASSGLSLDPSAFKMFLATLREAQPVPEDLKSPLAQSNSSAESSSGDTTTYKNLTGPAPLAGAQENLVAKRRSSAMRSSSHSSASIFSSGMPSMEESSIDATKITGLNERVAELKVDDACSGCDESRQKGSNSPHAPECSFQGNVPWAITRRASAIQAPVDNLLFKTVKSLSDLPRAEIDITSTNGVASSNNQEQDK